MMAKIDLSGAERRTMVSLSTAHLSNAAVEYLGRADPKRGLGYADIDPETDQRGLYEDRVEGRGGRRHRWFELGGNSILCMPHRYGFFVYAHDELGGDDADKVPPELAAILLTAAKSGFAWINFDCDAAPCKGLPLYEEAS